MSGEVKKAQWDLPSLSLTTGCLMKDALFREVEVSMADGAGLVEHKDQIHAIRRLAGGLGLRRAQKWSEDADERSHGLVSWWYRGLFPKLLRVTKLKSLKTEKLALKN
jgi:hypothetical protein